jgi:hypothetical protein
MTGRPVRLPGTEEPRDLRAGIVGISMQDVSLLKK